MPYVKAVLEAAKTYTISISRAAELLMIDESMFYARFPEIVSEVTE